MKISRTLERFRRHSSEGEQIEPEAKPAPAAEQAPEARAETEAEREPALELAPPPPEPDPDPEPEPEPEPPAVVPLVLRDPTPRTWNLWELERLADRLHGDDAEERMLLLVHLRQFADASGDLPVEFDPLVRDAFGADLAVLAR